MNMKKILCILWITLTLILSLPVLAFAEESAPADAAPAESNAVTTPVETDATTAPESLAETEAEATPESGTETERLCTCVEIPATKYCPLCGGLNAAYDADRWDCSCGAEENTTPFCPLCGEKHPDHDRFWICPTCEQKDNFFDTCIRCGAARPDKEGSGAKFHIDVDSLKTTLPIMGMGMLGIFLVIGAIALSVTILRKLPEKKEED